MIRSETPGDASLITSIHNEAFNPSELEAKLIVLLRNNPLYNPHLSLLAFEQDQAVGHILFFPLDLKTEKGIFTTLALAPLAVRPKFQRQGIGSKLVKEGLKQASELGYQSAFVVGSTKYYGKFGFTSVRDIQSSLGDYGEHFMSLELKPNSLNNIKGRLVYPPEFDIVR